METIKLENPWLVPTIDEFLFYCCPECDLKCRYSDDFLEHATKSHDLAKVSLQALNSLDEAETYVQNGEEFKNEGDVDVDVNIDVKPNVEDLQDAIIPEPQIKETRAKRKAKPSTKRSLL